MIKKFVAALFSLGLSAGAALAQSGCPAIVNTAVLTAGQWNACFALKQNVLGYVPLNTAGGTMTGKLVTAASTTLTAGFNIPQGTAPTSPINGDMWATSGGFFGRAGGVTYGPFVGAGSGTFAATLPLAVSFPSGVVTFALNYNSSFALSGSNLALAAHGVSNANLRQSIPLSVVGNPTVSSADVQDIQASAAYQPLRVDSVGSAVSFGALDVSQSAAVTGQLRAGSFPILTGAISTAGGSLTTTLVTAQPDAHTWAAVQTFTVAPVFTNQSGSRTALGLGTISTQNANAVAITGGTIAGLTGFAVRDTSAAFDLTFAATSSTPLSAGRALTFDVVNGARTIKIGSNLTIASDPGAVTGALKSNSTGTFAQAAASDLSNGSSGSGAVCLVTSCSMTTPIVAGGSITGLTTFALRDTSAAFDVTIAATSSSALSAGRTLTLNMGNVAHTLAFGTTANTITFPNLASFTVITNGDTGTVTNTMLAGSIAASKLVGTDITTVGALGAGSATTGFTIAASNVTWTGAVPIANLPVGTNAAKGIVQCDNTTITCTGGVITAVGASAASIDAGGATSISNGATGAFLFDNAGVVGKTTNPTTLTGYTVTANSLTSTTIQDASSSQDRLNVGVASSANCNPAYVGTPGNGACATFAYTANAAFAWNAMNFKATNASINMTAIGGAVNPTLILADTNVFGMPVWSGGNQAGSGFHATARTGGNAPAFFNVTNLGGVATSTITASISGTTLTVTVQAGAPLIVGETLIYTGVPAGLKIASFGTGTGGTGTYTLNQSLGTVTSRLMIGGASGAEGSANLNVWGGSLDGQTQNALTFFNAIGCNNWAAACAGTGTQAGLRLGEVAGNGMTPDGLMTETETWSINGYADTNWAGTYTDGSYTAPSNIVYRIAYASNTPELIVGGIYAPGTWAIGDWAVSGNSFQTGKGTLTFKEGGVVSTFTAGGGVFYVDSNGQPRYLNNNASAAVQGNMFLALLNADSGTTGHPVCFTKSGTHSSVMYVAAGTSCP